uniref:Uncharacterized protein n=1 Tax=Chaetoceros debilis TaxID=122233 RepID=A0A7S3V7J5_9STRA|mmetsp:Transcript_21288/g.32327  ORF Transcript_21288/g.32327 Transcript_21288/m.32327 type:complete len:322 (+) Transcript_21288:146-1111(+)
MKRSGHFLSLFLAFSRAPLNKSMSIGKVSTVQRKPVLLADYMKDLISGANKRLTNNAEATSFLTSSLKSQNSFDTEATKVVFSSELCTHQKQLSLHEYTKNVHEKHQDCLDLFDRYKSQVLRCENISTERASPDDCELNIKWEASWIPESSAWLYSLGEIIGWEIKQKSPDPFQVATFSYKNVFYVFQRAFETGVIALPVTIVSGNTNVKLRCLLTDESKFEMGMYILESIDLIYEADRGLLQNRRVAQELASWLDVSRRPIGLDPLDWAALVRTRVISGVPGAGSLDIDPNAEGEGEIAFILFVLMCSAALLVFYEVFLF